MESSEDDHWCSDYSDCSDDDGFSGIDRISNLPEGIISHILSFLPTVSAVATSVLARSWRSRWTKVSSFDFDDYGFLDCKRDKVKRRRRGYYVPKMNFGKFVSMVLRKHSAEFSVDRLRVMIRDRDFPFKYPGVWAKTAIAQNVRVLDLQRLIAGPLGEYDYRDYEYLLPSALYTCATLEVLKLRGPFVVGAPPTVCLPKLTLLELDFVKYELGGKDSDECLRNLVSGSPMLQSLRIERNHFDGMVVCTISNPVLKRLEYVHDFCRNDCDICLIHADSSEFDHYFKLEIDASALEYVSLDDRVSDQITGLEASTSLDEMVIENTAGKKNVSGLLRALGCRLKILDLSRATKSDLLEAGDLFPANLESIAKLVIQIDPDEFSWLMELIRGCIKLEVLNIKTWTNDCQTCWKDPVIVPKSLLSSLTRFSLSVFRCREGEIAMLKFMLNHGSVLQKVDIKASHMTRKEKSQLHRKLSMLPKASQICKISFS